MEPTQASALVCWGLVLLLVAPAALAQPEQVHLSQIEHTITVTWAVPGPPLAPPAAVEYGGTPALGLRAEGRFVAYLDAAPFAALSAEALLLDLAEAPVSIYRAYLPIAIDQAPGETRFYRIVSDQPTPAQGVRTLPGPDEPVTLVHIADQGTTEDGMLGAPAFRPVEVALAAAAVEADAILSAGDLAYQKEGEQRFWNQWFQLNEPLFAHAPYFPTPGNHDSDLVIGYAQWDTRFELPRDGRSYSFDAGPVHVLALNSDEMCVDGIVARVTQRFNPDCTSGIANPDLMRFIREDLADASERAVPWTVAMFHHPPYSNGSYSEARLGGNYVRWMRETWLPIFESHGVDLVINGHDHNYQRTYPIVAEQVTVAGPGPYQQGDGIVYVISGGGGRDVGLAPGNPFAPWQAVKVAAHQYLLIEADDAELKVTSVDVPSGAPIDAFVIERESDAAAAATTPPSDGVGWLSGLWLAGLAVWRGRPRP